MFITGFTLSFGGFVAENEIYIDKAYLQLLSDTSTIEHIHLPVISVRWSHVQQNYWVSAVQSVSLLLICLDHSFEISKSAAGTLCTSEKKIVKAYIHFWKASKYL